METDSGLVIGKFVLFYSLIFHKLQAKCDCATLCLNKKSMSKYVLKFFLNYLISGGLHSLDPTNDCQQSNSYKDVRLINK